MKYNNSDHAVDVLRGTLEFTIEAASTQRALQNVKCRKATGPDNIPPWMVKHYAHLLAAPVTAIFNSSQMKASSPIFGKLLLSFQFQRNIHPAHWKTTSGRFHLRQYWRKYLKELC